MEFSSVSGKNKHIKNIHNQRAPDNRKSHVICPLCTENKFICGTYNNLQTHLEVSHRIKTEVLTSKFISKERYEQWLGEEKIEMNYAMCRTRRNTDHIEKTYICNRSNSTGNRVHLEIFQQIYLIFG